MPLHFLNESDAPRECPNCHGIGWGRVDTSVGMFRPDCPECNGTGRLNANAKPDVETDFDGQVWWHRSPGETVGYPRKCFDTEAQALEAARKANR